jgi:DNA-binding LacI/PurR family transcriptional regulator
MIALGRIDGLALACRYLAAQGHHRISVLVAPDTLATDRFVDALGDTSVSLEAVGAGVLGVSAALGQIRQGQGRPTAIVCDSDVAALAILQGCAAEGVAVPLQASVVGFGDAPFARYSVPPLSTIRVPVERIGVLAAKAVMDLASRRIPSFTLSPAKLVLRQSSGVVV